MYPSELPHSALNIANAASMLSLFAPNILNAAAFPSSSLPPPSLSR